VSQKSVVGAVTNVTCSGASSTVRLSLANGDPITDLQGSIPLANSARYLLLASSPYQRFKTKNFTQHLSVLVQLVSSI
jgi:hypothetical protein